MLQNKKLIQIIFFLSILLSCKTNQTELEENNSNGKMEGWAGSPEAPNKKPFDYFYIKTTGRASDISLKKRNSELIKSSCVKASNAFPNFKNLMAKIILWSNSGFSGTASGGGYENDKLINSFVKIFNKELNEIKILNCIPLYEDEINFPNLGWKDCECTAYINIIGGKEKLVDWFEKYSKRINKKL